jgi:hypothetical protein
MTPITLFWHTTFPTSNYLTYGIPTKPSHKQTKPPMIYDAWIIYFGLTSLKYFELFDYTYSN